MTLFLRLAEVILCRHLELLRFGSGLGLRCYGGEREHRQAVSLPARRLLGIDFDWAVAALNDSRPFEGA